jgi:hypothetical protein
MVEKNLIDQERCICGCFLEVGSSLLEYGQNITNATTKDASFMG